MNEITVAALSRHDDRPGCAASPDQIGRVEPEVVASVTVRVVALVTVLFENWFDVAREVDGGRRRRRWRRGLRAKQHGACEEGGAGTNRSPAAQVVHVLSAPWYTHDPE